MQLKTRAANFESSTILALYTKIKNFCIFSYFFYIYNAKIVFIKIFRPCGDVASFVLYKI